MSPIEGEPVPRFGVGAERSSVPLARWVELPRSIQRPAIDFFDVLEQRRSCLGGAVPAELLSSVLWHSTLLRGRRPGRFGIDRESRAAPSAGGLHPIRLMVLPLEDVDHQGLYDDREHALAPFDDPVLALNRVSIAEILQASSGTTLQFAADRALVEACYDNAASLLWRDAGALAATICLVATALGVVATPVGRTGEAIVRAAGLPPAFVGAGAVHLGTRRPDKIGGR